MAGTQPGCHGRTGQTTGLGLSLPWLLRHLMCHGRYEYSQVSDVVHHSPALDGVALGGDVVVVDLQENGTSERAVTAARRRNTEMPPGPHDKVPSDSLLFTLKLRQTGLCLVSEICCFTPVTSRPSGGGFLGKAFTFGFPRIYPLLLAGFPDQIALHIIS